MASGWLAQGRWAKRAADSNTRTLLAHAASTMFIARAYGASIDCCAQCRFASVGLSGNLRYKHETDLLHLILHFQFGEIESDIIN